MFGMGLRRLLTLTMRAIVGGASGLPDLTYGSRADPAGGILALINLMALLKASMSAIRMQVVAQCASSGINGFSERLPDLGEQPFATLFADAVSGAQGRNAGAKQAFRGVNVAHANQQMAVHQNGFDRAVTLSECFMQPRGGHFLRKRLRAQVRKERMRLKRRCRVPDHGAKASGIMQAKQLFIQ